MNPQIQASPVHVTQPIQQEVKKCNNLPVIIILVLLLIGSCAFGGYELWQGLQKDSQITKLEESEKTKDLEITKLLKEKEDLQESSNTNNKETKESSPISVEEAEKILEKYLGEGIYTCIADWSSSYQLLSNFNLQAKIAYAYESYDSNMLEKCDCVVEYFEGIPCGNEIISFKSLDERYKLLFGDNGFIEKKNYVFYPDFWDNTAGREALVYDSSRDAYRICLHGVGGDPEGVAYHKVVSVDKEGDNVIASLFWAEFPSFIGISSYRGSLNEGGISAYADGVISQVRSTSIYKFTLSPYNGSYVLTDVVKE